MYKRQLGDVYKRQEQGIEIIRKAPANSRFFLHARIDAKLADDPEHYIPDAFCAGVRMTRAEAMAFMRDAWRDSLAARRAVMPITEYVGEPSQRWSKRKRAVVTSATPERRFWIG